MAAPEPPSAEAGRLTELRSSARGWHGVQLAVIGFIGLCGVLQDGGTATPTGIEVLAGILALSALAAACIATFLVGSAAWPLYAPERAPRGGDDDAELRRTSRRLTSGLALTFVAVALLALSAASGWWPGETRASSDVEVQAQSQTFCGRLAGSAPGAVAVVGDRGEVVIPLARITAIRPVDGC